ncbi:hypothetical protein CJ030_MR4G018361 [Morella rubra]|uniref:Uncharacterized protein n=1 Tax=Morella rubra TaxID=262757 RepID=A0A6A1VWT8_9ROSI|nr:hypothetical protein CJ030_MR4G018361 [Morella rubra]
MKLFEDELTYDFYPYILVLKIRTWVSDFLEVSVEHKPTGSLGSPHPSSPVPPPSPLSHYPRYPDLRTLVYQCTARVAKVRLRSLGLANGK